MGRGADHGRVTSAQLRRRAEARGVTTAYRDWRDRRVQVSDETLMAVLDALGPESSVPPLGSGLGLAGLGQPGLGLPVLGQPVLDQSGLGLSSLGQRTALAGSSRSRPPAASAAGGSPSSCTRSGPAGPGATATCGIWQTWPRGAAAASAPPSC